MLKVLSLLFVLASTKAWAQLPPPPVVTLTYEERMIVNEALEKFYAAVMAMPVPDVSVAGRATSIRHEMFNYPEERVNPTSLPIIGMALSRNSKDPKACALLQKLEPSARCVQ